MLSCAAEELPPGRHSSAGGHQPQWLTDRCCTSQLYDSILIPKLIIKPAQQAADLPFQAVGVAGFEPTASSSRTAGRAVHGGHFRRSLAGSGRCRPVLVGGVAVFRSCTAALAAHGWDWP
jgi:hypothetical protein